MSTFGTMIDRIETETRRKRIRDQIKAAIATAITLEEIYTYYFSQGRATTETQKSKAYYALPANFQNMRSLKCTVNNSSYPVISRSFEYLDEIDTGQSNQGFPEFYCLWNKQLRLYPVPGAAYPLLLAYIKSQPALVNDNDTNDWMTDGEILIRQRAKAIIYRDIVKGPEGKRQADECEAAAVRAQNRLKSETRKRIATGTLRPHGYSGAARA